MDESLYVAADLGAGSGRVFLAGIGDGHWRFVEMRRFHYPPVECDGHLRWDLPRMLDEVKPFPNGFDWASPVIGAREFHGQRVPVFPAANDFVYLCFHAAKHHWERLQWLLDIAAWMRRPEFDLDEVVASAEREGFGPVVKEGVWWAHAVLGVKPLMSRPVDPGEGARAARRFVVQHFGSPALRPLFRTWYGSVLYPRVSQRLRFWLDRLTEWAFVKIPRLHPTADEGGKGA